MSNPNPRENEVPEQPVREHPRPPAPVKPLQLREHFIEVASDSGEGARKCGHSFASIAADMDNGIRTVEIIPAESAPPQRSIAVDGENRIRIGWHRVTKGGDEADSAVSFDEQMLRGRLLAG